MGLWQDFRNFIRLGVPARTLDERALVKYSSYEVLAPEWSMVDAETMARDGHRKNALAYACIEYVARAVATPVLEAVKETSDGYEQLPPLDPLSLLLERPSLDYPSQTRFFRQVVRNLMLTGECILYKVPGDRTGRVVELQMLPSNKVSVERKSSAGEKVYLYHYDPALPPKRLKAEEVLFVKLDDSLNRDRGLAPLAAAARETDVDNATADIRKSFFEHGAILEGILTTEQQANEKQLKEWAAMWSHKYGGPKNAGKTPALAGGLSYQTVGATPDKWAFKEVTGLTEARICSAFGVPPILVGAKIGLDRSTYANYKEARSAFWEDTATPLLVFLADEFTGGLTDLSDGRRCRWNTDEVPALQEDADSREERAGRSLGKGTITINEYREAAGLEPVDDGDYYMMPQNVKLVAEGEIEEFAATSSGATPEQLKPFTGEEDPDDKETPATDPEEGPEEEAPPAEEGSRAAHQGVRLRPVRREIRDSRSQEEIERLERRLSRAIEGVFGTQAEAVAEKVGDTLEPDELLDLTVEAERMAEAATPHIRSILEEAGTDAATEAQDEGFGEGEFDPEGEDAVSYIETAPLLLGYEMARHTRDLVGETIAAVQAANPEGWTTDEIADRLREIIVDRDRANLAAETETVRTSNRAARFAYRQAGVTELEWFTTSPEPCEFCRAMEGRTVSVDEAFAALGDEIEGAEGGVRTVDYEDLWDTLHPRCGCGVRPANG